MALPIDVKALLEETMKTDAARNTPISISVYIDDAAPTDVIAHVRQAYASTLPTVRLAITYLGSWFSPNPTDDVAVVVAGASDTVGGAAASLRAVGVPTMVVTTMPAIVAGLAEQAGNPIPEGDLVSPVEGEGTLADEPFALDEARSRALNERMGRWIVATCHEKRLAFALAFPFVRRPLANDAVLATSLQNAGVGLVPILAGADLPIMTMNQAKMVLQIAAAYGHPLGKERLMEIIPVVGNAFFCRTIARELLEFVPFLGFVIRPGIGFVATEALGRAIIEYFEGGASAGGAKRVITSATSAGKRVYDLAQDVMQNIPGLGK